MQWRDTAFARSDIPPQFERLFLLLKTAMLERELYVDPACTLASLAKAMETNTSYVSKLINSVWKMNASAWIALFRLSRFVTCSSQEKESLFTVEGLALSCGFASKSAFYSACRSRFGIAPAELVRVLRTGV